MASIRQLFRRDMLAFWRDYPGKMIDMLSFFITNTVVFGYFVPTSTQYGAFFVIGAIVSFGLIEIAGKVSVLLADIEGERAISHSLVLPLRSEVLFIYIGFFWALNSLILAVVLFPLSKLLLWNQLDLGKIDYLRFIIIFFAGNLFFGFFALWLTSILRGIGGLGGLWARVIGPMWMFGCYFYSWKTVYALSPTFAYLHFLNPMVYIMEGSRSAAFGPEGYLPYWFCLVALAFFILAFTAHAIYRLKKRLDCI